MAYKKSSSCGGLRYNTTDFTEVDGVLTSATTKVDTYTPTYSAGVTAKFNEDKYIEAYEKKTTTFTATVVDTTTTWSDGTSTVADMSVVGLSDIVGVVDGYISNVNVPVYSPERNIFQATIVDGFTIKITYAEQTVPRTELVGDPFLASMCGDIWFDDGVFGEVGRVITTAGTSVVTSSFASNCSLLFDASKFEVGDDKEICLK